MAGVRAWRPIKCRPAAVSQSQGMDLEAFIGMALMGSGLLVAPWAATSGIMTVAILAAALAGALPLLPSALGGGPLYLLVSEWRNAHDLALHALYA